MQVFFFLPSQSSVFSLVASRKHTGLQWKPLLGRTGGTGVLRAAAADRGDGSMPGRAGSCARALGLKGGAEGAGGEGQG